MLKSLAAVDRALLRAVCDEYGLILGMDEVQTGMGRTGKLFAHEWAGITPDVMSAAKGIGGGFPLGAVLAKEQFAKALVPGSAARHEEREVLARQYWGMTIEEIGLDVASAVGTRTYGATLRVPIFDGGRRDVRPSHWLYFPAE